MKTIASLCLTAVLLTLAACSGSGMTDRVVGKWQVVTTEKDTSKGLCYAISAPVSSEGTFKGNRGAAYLMVTLLKSGDEQVSVSSGYPYQHNSRVELATDEESFSLKFKTNVAWAHSRDEDAAIIEDIEGADSIQVRGITTHGQTTIDTYSSEGFTDALARVHELCP